MHTHGEIIIGPCPCLRCGYELRGTPRSGVCPECGLGKSRSLRSLYRSSSDHLRNLRSGFLLMAVATPIGVFCTLAAAGAMALTRKLGNAYHVSLLVRIDLAAFTLAVAVAALVGPALAQIGMGRLLHVDRCVDPRIARLGSGKLALRYGAAYFASVLALGLLATMLVSGPYPDLLPVVIALAMVTPVLWLARNLALAPAVNFIARRLAVRRRGGASVLLASLGTGFGALAVVMGGTGPGAVAICAMVILWFAALIGPVIYYDGCARAARMAMLMANRREQELREISAQSVPPPE